MAYMGDRYSVSSRVLGLPSCFKMIHQLLILLVQPANFDEAQTDTYVMVLRLLPRLFHFLSRSYPCKQH